MGKLEVRQVTKTFKTALAQTKAIDDLSVTFETGKVYGLLGRNAVGKTTLLKLLMTQYLPDSGQITYDGSAVYENEEVLQKLCLFMDSMPAFSSFKISQILSLAEVFYGNWSKEQAEYLMDLFELNQSDRYGMLSKGKKTAVSIVLGLASGCEITMFDEIYSGLDAVMRKKFYDLLMEEYAESGRTFILSTHLIDEMSSLFTDVVIMEQGKVIVQEEMEMLEASVISARGTKEQLELVAGAEVLNESVFAGSITRIIRGSFEQEQLSAYKKAGLEVKRLSLQEIFIAISEHDRGK